MRYRDRADLRLAVNVKMRAARMYGYNEPLRLEEIPVPEIAADEVLVKVAAAGMCRSDFQLIEGYFTRGAAGVSDHPGT